MDGAGAERIIEEAVSGEEWCCVVWTMSEPCLNRRDQADGREAGFNAASE